MSRNHTDPVFVGGTPRTGTTLTARMVGAHSSIAHLSRETVFHAHAKGLRGVIRGEISFEDFVVSMREFWWFRRVPEGRTRGLCYTLPRERFDLALDGFLEESRRLGWRGRRRRDNRARLSRELVRALLDPIADEQDADRWVDMSPQNAEAAGELVQMFPDMKLIHTVRDGRDAACSIAAQYWASGDVFDSLLWWEDRLKQADAGAAQLPPGRMFLLRLEELITNREQTWRSLLDFLEIDEEEEMQRTFDREVTPEKGHIERWQVELSRDDRNELDRRYREAIDRLTAHGVKCLPHAEASSTLHRERSQVV
jgi:sulfotransferase family protein